MINGLLRHFIAGFAMVPFLALLATACSQEKDHNSGVDAVISEEQLTDSHAIIDSIDYLPFEFTMDGCYARALYMSMELAAEGIPSSATFAFAQDEEHLLRLKDGTEWIYHVAPMVKLHREDEGSIIDPSIAPGRYLDLKDWLGAMAHNGGEPVVVSVQGSVYKPSSIPSRIEDVISSMAELRPFRAADVAEACTFMHIYLTEKQIDVASRQQKLIQRTGYLVQRLEGLGKLVNEEDKLGIICGDSTIPLQHKTGSSEGINESSENGEEAVSKDTNEASLEETFEETITE